MTRRSRRAGRPAGALRTASAGIATVGVAFGMARYGYGLLLPDMRAAYHLGTAALGLIAAGGYVAYLAASALAATLATRLSARALVMGGGGCAAGGMVLVALTHSAAGLALGVLVAGASAGLVLPPFSDVVATQVTPARRERTLAAISSGTGWGVAVAAPVALLAGGAWRTAWLVWAALAVVATAWAARVLPRGAPAPMVAPVRLRLAWFVCPRSGPLLLGALLVGLGASVFWTFAVELLEAGGGLPPAAARVFLLVVGVASVGGTLAGDAVRRLGARTVMLAGAGLLAGSLALLGAFPGSPATAMAAGAAFGVTYNVVVAVENIWSAEVFPERPSAGLAAVMAALGAGLLLGPLLAAVAAHAVGLRGAFAAAAVLVAASAVLRPAATVTSGTPG